MEIGRTLLAQDYCFAPADVRVTGGMVTKRCDSRTTIPCRTCALTKVAGDIDRSTFRRLVLQWAAGELTEQDVHETAERLWEAESWPDYGETDDRSIAIEVLAQLDILNHQLITPEDIPALIAFLETPPGQAADGWTQWRQYWASIDWDQRRRALSGNPYYFT